jgi:alpha-D-ribose 1-methylphosphonate 5-triphosphate synthase subunit PhnL
MLTVTNLRKTFIAHILDGKEIPGFKDVGFHVPAGKALKLAGPSGHGKSSVLKCIYRTYAADAGSILYESAASGTLELTRLGEHDMLGLRRTEIGYVTQFLSVLPRVPAVDVVADPLVGDGLPRPQAREAARRLLARLKIAPRLHDAYPCTFSGGEKQRVNLARSVIRPVRLLLLDEPTASLDPESMQVVRDILAEMKSAGTTMVAVFHDRSVMDELMDDVYRMPPREALPC